MQMGKRPLSHIPHKVVVMIKTQSDHQSTEEPKWEEIQKRWNICICIHIADALCCAQKLTHSVKQLYSYKIFFFPKNRQLEKNKCYYTNEEQHDHQSWFQLSLHKERPKRLQTDSKGPTDDDLILLYFFFYNFSLNK